MNYVQFSQPTVVRRTHFPIKLSIPIFPLLPTDRICMFWSYIQRQGQPLVRPTSGVHTQLRLHWATHIGLSLVHAMSAFLIADRVSSNPTPYFSLGWATGGQMPYHMVA